MKIDLKEIIEGWRNQLIPPAKLKKVIDKIGTERLSICRGCEFNSKNIKDAWGIRMDEHCVDCGCTLSAKTKCLSCSCPLEIPKWVAVISKAEEDEINEK